MYIVYNKCIQIYIYMHVYIHVCIYIYIYTYTPVETCELLEVSEVCPALPRSAGANWLVLGCNR